jgi:four helix bundle protein
MPSQESIVMVGSGGVSNIGDMPGKPYDLEERTWMFAKNVRQFVKQLPRTICNMVDVRQLARSSGSIAANYIEANESLSKKDFVVRVKIARKEAKESRMWLRLVDTGDDAKLAAKRDELIRESDELLKILSAIINKSK